MQDSSGMLNWFWRLLRRRHYRTQPSLQFWLDREAKARGYDRTDPQRF